MRKKERFMILDTETAGDVNRKESLRVYDLGFQVTDRSGEVYEEQSFVIADTFYLQSHEMQSAYYANKLPQYHDGIGQEWLPISFQDAMNEVRKIMAIHGIKNVWAYNVLFDYGALNNTLRIASNNYAKYFFPYGTKLNCIWQYAANMLMCSGKYYKFCYENGFVSDKGNVMTNAEVCYAYITDNPNYVEHHTALEDVLIEKAILLECLKRRVKQPEKKVNGSAWRTPQPGFQKWLLKHHPTSRFVKNVK